MNTRYEVQEPLGEGGFARTYRALDRRTRQTVCLKELHPELSLKARTVERFRLEGTLGRGINHPNVVGYREEFQGVSIADPTRTTWFLTTEFMPGGDLEKRVTREGPPPIKTAIQWAVQALSGLEEIHRLKISHRDYKPANLLLAADGSVKVADLGISRQELKSLGTIAGTPMGTLFWASPEQLKGDLNQINRPTSDLYAAGVSLYWWATGHFPAEDPDGNLLNPGLGVEELMALLSRPPLPAKNWRNDIPDRLQSILTRSLQREPRDRYQSAGEMRQSLEKILVSTGSPLGRILKCLEGPHRGDEVELWKPVMILGRSHGDVVFPNDPHMSRRHGSLECRSYADGCGWRFHNGEPTVCTQHNGKPLANGDVAPLQPGDRLKMGTSLFQFL